MLRLPKRKKFVPPLKCIFKIIENLKKMHLLSRMPDRKEPKNFIQGYDIQKDLFTAQLKNTSVLVLANRIKQMACHDVLCFHRILTH